VDGASNTCLRCADLHKMTDEQLVEHTTEKETVTPLENELARRLETYVEIFGDLQGGCEPWE